MGSVNYKGYRTGFPFLIPERAQDGLPVSVWGGTTFSSGPSKSSDEQIDVVGPGTMHPVGLTFAEAMEHFWRVKSYKCTVAGDGVDAGVYTADLIEQPWDALFTSITREIHLVTAKNSTFRFYSDIGFIGGVRIGGKFYFIRNSKTYYPEISIQLPDSRLFGAAWSSVKNEGVTGPVGSGSFCGESFPVYPQFDYSTWDPPLTTPTITITPHKYWTYGGLYDEDTGALV